MVHIPVMVEEVMKYLEVKEGGMYIDATAGAGGHLREIVERVGEKGRVIAIDQDRTAIADLRGRYADERGTGRGVLPYARAGRVTVVRGNFRYIENIAVKYLGNTPRPDATSGHPSQEGNLGNPLRWRGGSQSNGRPGDAQDREADGVGRRGVVDGILFDLGFSLDEIAEKGRGFSFEDDLSLDMRYGQGEHGEFLCECHTPEHTPFQQSSGHPSQEGNKADPLQRRGGSEADGVGNISAEDIVNTFSEKELADLFWKYGDERKSKFFAKKIVEYRRKKRIESAAELAYVIGSARPKLEGFQAVVRHAHAYPAPFEVFQKKLPSSSCLQEKSGREVRGQRASGGRLHPATKVFLALRIFVNQEPESLEEGLEGSWRILKRGGRCVVVSFHSGEDRIVKAFIRTQSQKGSLENLTKHVVKPSREEVLRNRLARSAVLRAFEKR